MSASRTVAAAVAIVLLIAMARACDRYVLAADTASPAGGPWWLYACLPDRGPFGCVLVRKPAGRATCIAEMDELSRDLPKGTTVICTNSGAGEPAARRTVR